MTRISRREVLSIIILLLLWGLLPSNISIHSETIGEVNTVNTAFGSISREVIRITNDTQLIALANEEGWRGDGSEGEPFVIENYNIDAGGKGSAVHIGNTTLHILLKDSQLHNVSWSVDGWNPGAAVTLHNARNVKIVNNRCYNSRFGILLANSDSNRIHVNTISDNTYYGIEMKNSMYNTVSENGFDNTGGLNLINSPHNSFYDNDFSYRGFSLLGTIDTYAEQDIPKNNTIDGKPIYYYSNTHGGGLAIPSDAGQVILGNVTSMKVEGLRLSGSTIIIGYSSEIDIHHNRVSQNPGKIGISIRSSESITLTNNILNDNQGGINMLQTSDSTVLHNTLSNNVETGLVLGHGSDSNLIDGNKLSGCGMTINSASYNTITNNLILKNMAAGIIIESGSNNNLLHSNAFLYNNRAKDQYSPSHIQARDSTGENNWNSSEGYGNYWRDWTQPDEDGDGIVDEPYKIAGSDSYDYYPLVEPFMPVPPYPATNLNIETGSGKLGLNWDIPIGDGGSDIIGYRIYRGNTSDNLRIVQDVEGASSRYYLDTGLNNEEVYYYRVSAFNSVGESIVTDIVSGEPDGTPPNLAFFTPANNTHTNQPGFEVSWYCSDTNSGVDYSQVRLNNETWWDVGDNTSYEFIDVQEGKHRVWVRVYDRAGNNVTRWINVFVDFTPPEIVSHRPVGNEIPIDFEVYIEFSEPMDRDTLIVSSFEIPFDYVEWIDNTTAVTRPIDTVEYDRTYNVFVEGTDLAGNELESYLWTFNTTDACILKGRVVDNQGAPMGGVEVSVGEEARSSTDHEGFFTVDGRGGTNTVTFQKEGYDGKRVHVTANAGEEYDMGEITLEPTSRRYEWLLIIASVSIVISGILAFALFMMRREETEISDDEDLFEIEEDTEILPAEFFD